MPHLFVEIRDNKLQVWVEKFDERDIYYGRDEYEGRALLIDEFPRPFRGKLTMLNLVEVGCRLPRIGKRMASNRYIVVVRNLDTRAWRAIINRGFG